MLELFWICFIVGIALSLVIVIFGELLEGIFDGIFELLSLEGPGFLHPVTVIGGLTAFGGAGVLLTRLGFASPAITIIFAFLIAVALSIIAYFIYVKPMKAAENSTSFSNKELEGNIGIVTVTVPAQGYGEVMIQLGPLGNITETASSYEGNQIPSGTKVVVVEYKDGAAYVSAFEETVNDDFSR